MSEAKRYYWLKLPENFFDAVDDDTISFIEEMEGGPAYVLFYLKLLCKALRTEGVLIRYVGSRCIPYNDAALAKLTGTPVDTVHCAVKVLQDMGLIQRLSTGELFLTQMNEFIGSETDKAVAMRKSRAKANLGEKGNNVTPLLPERYPDVTQSKSKSKSKEKEKEKEVDKEKDICSEPDPPPAELYADVEPVILNTGQEWRPTVEEYERYKRLYPAVDIAQAFREMSGWCDANPAKRKTADGVKRFVNSWLSRDQDSATRRGYTPEAHKPAAEKPDPFKQAWEEMHREAQT